MRSAAGSGEGSDDVVIPASVCSAVWWRGRCLLVSDENDGGLGRRRRFSALCEAPEEGWRWVSSAEAEH